MILTTQDLFSDGLGTGFEGVGGETPIGNGGGTSGGGLPWYVPSISLNLSGSGLTSGTQAAAQSDPQGTAVAILNQAEGRLQQNLADYQAAEHTLSRQQAALKVFDDTWAQVVTLLSDPRLGQWGAQGLIDRRAGGRYDWTAYYRTPISSDSVSVDAAGVGSVVAKTFASVWVLAALAALLVIILYWRAQQ